ncbi:hypothetical protein HNR44_002325 [Geomicrobium halophilum]|uniref:Uncharacterized protein n=1 Tax=Geomicrobium halophilum TaxID=549000 RepID=A0A841PZS3_9BACL|nr:hypothetical protein [Geomicrobium halophilum]
MEAFIVLGLLFFILFIVLIGVGMYLLFAFGLFRLAQNEGHLSLTRNIIRFVWLYGIVCLPTFVTYCRG